MKRLSLSNVFKRLDATRQPFQDRYLAMYSGLLGGVVTDPVLMVLPIDDHLVHRGDGVFDSCKCVNGGIYNLQAHLARLEKSAAAVGLAMPVGRDALANIVAGTVRAGGVRDCAVRILISRGPGSFSCNPYDCPESKLYVIVTTAGVPFMTKCPAGARVAISKVPAKPPFFAGVKNCNYLPNVLMEQEAADLGVDYMIGLDPDGFVGEGATQNFGIVNHKGVLCFPKLDNILRGTTMMRVVELAEQNIGPDTPLKGVDFQHLSVEAVKSASEMLMVGTTHNVAQVREFDGEPIGSVPGPVYKWLAKLTEDDVRENDSLRTVVF